MPAEFGARNRDGVKRTERDPPQPVGLFIADLSDETLVATTARVFLYRGEPSRVSSTAGSSACRPGGWGLPGMCLASEPEDPAGPSLDRR
jgi:hypothetical protein